MTGKFSELRHRCIQLFYRKSKYGSDACSTKKLVIEIIQNPVDSENLLLIFLTFLNPLSAYKKITYLMHEKICLIVLEIWYLYIKKWLSEIFVL